MLAVVIHRYGDAEQLSLEDVPTPDPGPGEVRVAVRAAGVNPVDWRIREGQRQAVFPNTFPLILGWDLAGVIDAIGPGVTEWEPGEEVVALTHRVGEQVRDGCYAEYVVVPADLLARLPRGLGFAEAASLPVAGLTAWQVVSEVLAIEPGQVVYVRGGAGGVGSFAVQLASRLGATVLASCSEANMDYVFRLGAERVLDYGRSDPLDAIHADFPDGIGGVFDCVGIADVDASMAVVRPGGKLVSVAGAPTSELADSRGIDASRWTLRTDPEALSVLLALLGRGEIRAPDVVTVPLSEVRGAHGASEAGHVRGKLVLLPGR